MVSASASPNRALKSCAAIVALLACVATAAPATATGSSTGGVGAPGPDLASGGVAAPDPAPVKSPAPKQKTVDRAPPSATTPANHTALSPIAPTHTAIIVARSSRPAAKRPRSPSRHPHRHHHAETRPSRDAPSGRVVPLPSWRLVAHATGSNGSQGRLVRAAIALFLVALAEGSLLLRLSAQLPRRA